MSNVDRLKEALMFIRSLAEEEYAYVRTGTGAEVALRHIIRKSNEALAEDAQSMLHEAVKSNEEER